MYLDAHGTFFSSFSFSFLLFFFWLCGYVTMLPLKPCTRILQGSVYALEGEKGWRTLGFTVTVLGCLREDRGSSGLLKGPFFIFVVLGLFPVPLEPWRGSGRFASDQPRSQL